MITFFLALALMFASASTEAPALREPSTVAVEAVQTPQEQALEVSAWESLELSGVTETLTEDTIVSYFHTVTVTVEDGDYTLGMYQFAVEDTYDNVYVHIFTVDTLHHA